MKLIFIFLKKTHVFGGSLQNCFKQKLYKQQELDTLDRVACRNMVHVSLRKHTFPFSSAESLVYCLQKLNVFLGGELQKPSTIIFN